MGAPLYMPRSSLIGVKSSNGGEIIVQQADALDPKSYSQVPRMHCNVIYSPIHRYRSCTVMLACNVGMHQSLRAVGCIVGVCGCHSAASGRPHHRQAHHEQTRDRSISCSLARSLSFAHKHTHTQLSLFLLLFFARALSLSLSVPSLAPSFSLSLSLSLSLSIYLFPLSLPPSLSFSL